MKIIIVKPHAHIKMDSDVYCDAIEKLGHKVVKAIFHNDRILLNDRIDNADIIWCPYEQEISTGIYMKERLNIPLVGHFEWCPPWRVGIDSPLKWGYRTISDIENVEQLIPINKERYLYFINCYEKCDLKTTPTKYCLNTLSHLKDINTDGILIKPYIIDDELLLKYDKEYKKKNQILTIGRLVPHKRILHIIFALSKLKNPPLLKILGFGEEKQTLIEMAESRNVKIEFVGTGQEGDKVRHIKESLFLVTPCASLPAGEAALFKVPTIIYDIETIVQKHPDIGTFVKTNDIDELANKIQFYIDNPDEIKKDGEKYYNALISGNSGICLSKDGANKMIEIFEKVVKNDA